MKKNNIVTSFNSDSSDNSSNNKTQKKLMSLKELSASLCKTENSIRYHLRMGRIKPAFKLGRSYSFDLESVMKQLQQSIKQY